MYRFLIQGETVSKKNNRIILRNNKTIPSVRYKMWHESAILQMRAKVRECIDDKCSIILIFTHGDNLRRDSDNGVSSIFDTLQDINVLADDRWQIVKNHHVFNSFEKKKPSCEVLIYKADEKEMYLRDLINFSNIYY